jgi:peptide/nickel transport system substrate-binding protein
LLCALGCKSRDKKSDAVAGTGPRVVSCTEQGCPPPADGAPTNGGTLRVWVEAEPPTLCDLVEHDAWSRWIVENQIVETLLEQDPGTGAIAPRLATTIKEETVPGGRRLTLELRSGVEFHDGHPFTSADVVFTLELARDPKVGADQRAELEAVRKISAPDARTVVIELSKPAPFIKQTLAHLTILPRHLFQDHTADLRKAPAARAPVGTGPFRFGAWDSGREITIERNDKYWGDKAHFDRVAFRIVRDRSVAQELYRRGELDVIWRVPPSDRALATDASLAGHTLYSWPLRAYGFIVWNTTSGPLADARVRRALALLLDRDRYAKIAFHGAAVPITGPYAPSTPSYDKSVTPWPRDVAKAKQLLVEAGHKDGFKFTFLYTAGSRTVQQLGQIMKEDFAAAGVEVDLLAVDWATQLERLRKHQFDVSSLQWTLALEQDNYPMFHSSQKSGGQNYGNFSDPAIDALLDEVRATDDDDKRHAIDRKLHAALYERQPYLFLLAQRVDTLLAPRVRGLSPSTGGLRFARGWLAP